MARGVQMSWLRTSLLVLVSGAGVGLTGCGVQRPAAMSAPGSVAGVTGRVHGGQQPVAGSTIQLYTVGTTGDGSAASPLLTQTVTTDVNGDFNITGLYSCTSATEVYITATGGQPTNAMTNANLAMMTALGPCSSLSSSTFVTINEVTTVGAVAALAPYMTSYSAVGSGTGDAAALAAAFTTADAYADPSVGVSPGPDLPGGYAAPSSEINSLADSLAACLNSSGGVSGDKSACGNLFALTTPTNGNAPTNSIAALLNVANNPTLNTAALFYLGTTTAPFQPTLTVAPANFQIALMPLGGSASLTVSPASLSYSGTAVTFSSAAQTVTITNSGAGAVTLNSIGIIGANAADFAVGANTCGSGLTATASCTVTVVFTPSALGARTASLQVSSSTSGSPQYVALTGMGAAPSAGPISTSVSTLSYTVGNTTEDVLLENYGSTPLTIKSIVESDAAGPYQSYFNVQSNTCGNMLPAQSVCTISVQSTAGGVDSNDQVIAYSGTLTITDDASTGPQTVALSSANGAFINSTGTFTYSQVGVSVSASILATSGYYYSATLTPTIGGTNAGDFSAPAGCSISAFSGRCSFPLTFKPTAAGLRTAKMYINGTGGQYVPLSGTGLNSGPFFTLSETSISLSNALPSSPDPNSIQTNSLVLTNYGTTTFAFSASFTGPNASLMSINGSACASVAPQASCTATVSFYSSVVGSFAATLIVKDANSSATASVAITATTGYWGIGLFPDVLTFSDQAPGTTSAAQSFVVADGNDYPIGHPLSVALQAGSNFVLTQGSTCAASSVTNCTLAVAFSPHTIGPIYELLVATDQFTGDTYNLQLLGTGGASGVSLSATSLTFPARTIGTTSVPMVVTLTNSGTQTLAVSGVSVVGAVNGNFTQTNNCSVLAANGTCTINVSFAPTASGPQSATVKIVSNAPSSPDSIAVSGTTN